MQIDRKPIFIKKEGQKKSIFLKYYIMNANSEKLEKYGKKDVDEKKKGNNFVFKKINIGKKETLKVRKIKSTGKYKKVIRGK